MAKRKTPEDVLLYQTIGARVFQCRVKRKLDQAGLAERARLHLNTISNLESGEGVSLPSLMKVANALGVVLAELLPNSQCLVSLFENNMHKR